ncbi:MAG: hypothetical protein JXB23_03500 [Candidatus Aminicenantes bacterium]|nr:hypothetical protein [Candidatus Aminicenantes bacterium]
MRWKKAIDHSGSVIPIMLLVCLLVFSTICCDSIFGTDEADDTTTDEDEEARIIVTNNFGESLDIYMDGTFLFSLNHDDSETIDDVSLDEHTLEAKKLTTTTVVASAEIDVTNYIDYSWSIDDPPDINVTNQYGHTLKVYMDGNYQFDIVDEENRWIVDVSFGERFLKANRASDGKEVASITLDISENKDYTWTVE